MTKSSLSKVLATSTTPKLVPCLHQLLENTLSSEHVSLAQPLGADPLHPRVMKETLPKISLSSCRRLPVAVQVAIPLAMLRVGKVLVAPIVNELMPASVFEIACQRVGHEGRDDCLIVRPPEFHVLPILLNGFAV